MGTRVKSLLSTSSRPGNPQFFLQNRRYLLQPAWEPSTPPKSQVNDSFPFPISVSWKSAAPDSQSAALDNQQCSIVFPKGNPIPSTKNITIGRSRSRVLISEQSFAWSGREPLLNKESNVKAEEA